MRGPARAQRAGQRQQRLGLQQRLAAREAHEAVGVQLERLGGGHRLVQTTPGSGGLRKRPEPRASSMRHSAAGFQVCGESHQRQRRSQSPKRTKSVGTPT